MSITFEKESFETRHNGPSASDMEHMLRTVRAGSLDELVGSIIPKGIRLQRDMGLPEPLAESEYLAHLRSIAGENQIFRSFIGMGYAQTLVPHVILRNVLENPGWYTAYTPYQAEIAQGRMEALVNFQTMVTDLTGMEIANASLLDEATAAAEAVSLLYDARSRSKRHAATFFASDACHPQTLAVLRTRTEPLGIRVAVGPAESVDVTDPDLFGILLPYPDSDGRVADPGALIQAAHEHDVRVAVVADLLALALLTPPGERGADVVVGTAQRFGVPMGYGGPHAAYFATRAEFQRKIPGRIIGLTKDAEGRPAYRMALQTREQHIRREKATSNICTAQVLLAVMSGMYAVWHGPEGLKRIAGRVHGLAALTARMLQEQGVALRYEHLFDTLRVALSPEQASTLHMEAEATGMNLRYHKGGDVGITFDEAKNESDVVDLLGAFARAGLLRDALDAEALAELVSRARADLQGSSGRLPEPLLRTSPFMEHPVFHRCRTEHEMLRYLKELENRDLSLTHSMIPLGSCTMKLNATVEMIPVTWPEFGSIHPFAPAWQARGYARLFHDLEQWLREATGFHAVSLQPNSGAQGEYAGLMVIRAYHMARGEAHRDVTIVPSSAHGTNPASAVMAGMRVVVTKCDDNGNIDLDDLREKAQANRDRLAALMVTYPSTHGVFEEEIREICDIVHKCGGRVYMDGANMNAQVGLTSPAAIGADVCHLNLHKTFCIPHGGGGPGMGPIGVVEDLAPFLPGHPLVPTGGGQAISPVSAAPYGSASILTISHAYIRLMGAEGLKRATQVAILNANYIMERLKEHYPVLYTGRGGRAAHEFILDLRGFRTTAGIEATDIAKRLMDYGFHAPTMSFPVAGTLMIEPTESESLAELDRFCDAMISIREEIRQIEQGRADRQDNLLKNAPHTASRVMADNWPHAYSREQAAFPLPGQAKSKFWPNVSRVDDAYGDRNLVCTCMPLDAYLTEAEPESAPSPQPAAP